MRSRPPSPVVHAPAAFEPPRIRTFNLAPRPPRDGRAPGGVVKGGICTNRTRHPVCPLRLSTLYRSICSSPTELAIVASSLSNAPVYPRDNGRSARKSLSPITRRLPVLSRDSNRKSRKTLSGIDQLESGLTPNPS